MTQKTLLFIKILLTESNINIPIAYSENVLEARNWVEEELKKHDSDRPTE